MCLLCVLFQMCCAGDGGHAMVMVDEMQVFDEIEAAKGGLNVEPLCRC